MSRTSKKTSQPEEQPVVDLGNRANRMVSDSIKVRTPCVTCKHRTTSEPVCAAFPTGIPYIIWSGANNHKTPFPGDNGIHYEPDPRMAKAFS